MRRLSEIIESAKSGEKPNYEECFYAMLVLDFLLMLDSRTVQQLANPDNEYEAKRKCKQRICGQKTTMDNFIKKLKMIGSFAQKKEAYNKSPKDWMGWEYDPFNPEYQKRRKASRQLADKLSKKSTKICK